MDTTDSRLPRFCRVRWHGRRAWQTRRYCYAHATEHAFPQFVIMSAPPPVFEPLGNAAVVDQTRNSVHFRAGRATVDVTALAQICFESGFSATDHPWTIVQKRSRNMRGRRTGYTSSRPMESASRLVPHRRRSA